MPNQGTIPLSNNLIRKGFDDGIVAFSFANKDSWKIANNVPPYIDNFDFSSSKLAFTKSDTFTETALVNEKESIFEEYDIRATMITRHSAGQPAYIGLAFGINPNKLGDTGMTGFVTWSHFLFPNMLVSTGEFNNGNLTLINDGSSTPWLDRKIGQNESFEWRLNYSANLYQIKIWLTSEEEPENFLYSEPINVDPGLLGVYVEFEEPFDTTFYAVE